MQTIDINTTQNVRITYEIAGLWDRVLSYIIDLLIIGAATIVSLIFGGIIGGESGDLVYYILVVPIFIFYNIISEISFNGQTWGKKAMNLKVVKLDGKEAMNSDYFLRWVFRMVDIYLSIGTIAVMFVATSKKGQRLGDLISDTTVIRIKPAKTLNFVSVMKRYEAYDHQPQFPQVRLLSEEDMVLIQTVMLRLNQFPNEASRKSARDLIIKIKEKLRLSDHEVKSEPKEFFSTLISDYVAVTR